MKNIPKCRKCDKPAKRKSGLCVKHQKKEAKSTNNQNKLRQKVFPVIVATVAVLGILISIFI